MPRKEIYWKTREKCLEQNKKYYNNNKEHTKEYHKEWYKKNKEHCKEYDKEYAQTDVGKKVYKISDWRKRGLICDNYEALYEKYINTWECDNCGVELVSGPRVSNSKCMDHCHKTGKFRNILCHSCNIQRGFDDRSNLIGL
jgi:ribosomal protein S20